MNLSNDLELYRQSPGEELFSTLHLVEIYFDTATFDDIERDKKIKTEAQLSLIGGTMGLLTGFSIISGVEIVFFLIRLVDMLAFSPDINNPNAFRLVSSFRTEGASVWSAMKSKLQNCKRKKSETKIICSCYITNL